MCKNKLEQKTKDICFFLYARTSCSQISTLTKQKINGFNFVYTLIENRNKIGKERVFCKVQEQLGWQKVALSWPWRVVSVNHKSKYSKMLFLLPPITCAGFEPSLVPDELLSSSSFKYQGNVVVAHFLAKQNRST